MYKIHSASKKLCLHPRAVGREDGKQKNLYIKWGFLSGYPKVSLLLCILSNQTIDFFRLSIHILCRMHWAYCPLFSILLAPIGLKRLDVSATRFKSLRAIPNQSQRRPFVPEKAGCKVYQPPCPKWKKNTNKRQTLGVDLAYPIMTSFSE